jgi:hypothetical protein
MEGALMPIRRPVMKVLICGIILGFGMHALDLIFGAAGDVWSHGFKALDRRASFVQISLGMDEQAAQEVLGQSAASCEVVSEQVKACRFSDFAREYFVGIRNGTVKALRSEPRQREYAARLAGYSMLRVLRSVLDLTGF